MKAFPKDKFRVRVTRFYRDRDAVRRVTPGDHNLRVISHDMDLMGATFTDEKYAIRVSLHPINETTVSPIPLLQVWSRCNKMDQPSRKEGVRIAMERLEAAARGMGII